MFQHIADKEDLMQTWMFMMGLQMIIFVICAVWVGVWMRQPKDKYDEALEKMAEENLGRPTSEKE